MPGTTREKAEEKLGLFFGDDLPPHAELAVDHRQSRAAPAKREAADTEESQEQGGGFHGCVARGASRLRGRGQKNAR